MRKDVHAVGGVPMIARALIASGHLDGATVTLSGETLAQACAGAPEPDGAVIRTPTEPISPTAASSCSRAISRPTAR